MYQRSSRQNLTNRSSFSPRSPTNYYKNNKDTTYFNKTTLCVTFQCIAILILFSSTLFYYSHCHIKVDRKRSDKNRNSIGSINMNQNGELGSQLGRLRKEDQQKQIRIRELERSIERLDEENRKLKEINRAMNPNDNNNNNAAQAQPVSNEHFIRLIQKQDMTFLHLEYNDILEKGNIKVQFETTLGNFIIEMAPVELMPHSIRYFLRLVEDKFWNGCHFFRNAGHVIQANCHHKEGGIPKAPSILFQEYTTEFNHLPNTIGIAGRPGGPDFYVNKVDNIRNHGPGGQGPEPDPCFAKIIDGFDTIRKISDLTPDPNKQMSALKDEEWVKFNNVFVIKD